MAPAADSSVARRAFAVLAVGVLAASLSSILVRYAQADGIDSIAIAAWRLIIAAAFLMPLAWMRNKTELARLSRQDLTVAGAAGVALALHFGAWISSLEYTTVASSAALVTTNPIWVALATVFIFRQKLSRLTVIGTAVALAGCVLLVLADARGAGATASGVASGMAPDPMLGNALALLGAVCVSTYLLTGRALAARISLLSYVALVYGATAVVLLGAALLKGAAMGGYSTTGWASLIGLAIGPQLIGHSAFNYALRRLSPTFVALSILGEPVGSAILAALLLREVPGLLQALAFAVLMLGIGVGARGERRDAIS